MSNPKLELFHNKHNNTCLTPTKFGYIPMVPRLVMWLVTETRGLNPSGSTWFKQRIIQYKQKWATKAQGTSNLPYCVQYMTNQFQRKIANPRNSIHMETLICRNWKI